MAGNNPDIRLLFGVQGGGTLDRGSSGELIQRELTSIVNAINQNPFQIRFAVDTTFLQDIRHEVEALQNALRNLAPNEERAANRIVRQDALRLTNALSQIESLRSSLQSTMSKATSNSGLAGMNGHITELRNLSERLNRLTNDVQQTDMTGRTFTLSLRNIGLEARRTKNEIGQLVDAAKQSGTQNIISLGSDPEELAKALTKIERLRGTIQSSLFKADGNENMTSQANALREMLRSLDDLARNADGMTADRVAASLTDIGLSAQRTKNEISLLTDAMKRNQVEETNIVQGSREYAAAERQIDSLINKISSLQTKFIGVKNGNVVSQYNNLSTYAAQVDRLKAELQAGRISQDQFNTSIAALRSDVAQAEASLSGYHSVIATVKDQFSSLTQQVMGFYTAHQLISKGINAIKDMVRQATDLETAFADTRIVTHATTEELENYASTISDIANETSTSMNDLISATTTYARLGYDLGDSTMLAKYTAMLERVGNIDPQRAEEALTAILKAFPDDVSIENIESAMDKLVVTGKVRCPNVW